jgi:hypothetical protein
MQAEALHHHSCGQNCLIVHARFMCVLHNSRHPHWVPISCVRSVSTVCVSHTHEHRQCLTQTATLRAWRSQHYYHCYVSKHMPMCLLACVKTVRRIATSSTAAITTATTTTNSAAKKDYSIHTLIIQRYAQGAKVPLTAWLSLVFLLLAAATSTSTIAAAAAAVV